MALTANCDLLDSDRDKAAARIGRIDRLLSRRYVDDSKNLSTAQRIELELERDALIHEVRV